MYIHTFGRQDRPAILLLHPMGLPGETLFGIFREFVPDDYFVIFPDQGGHGKSGGYESVGAEATVLTDWLLETGHSQIQLVFGASMGAALAYELMKRDEIRFERVWLEGASLLNDAKAMRRFLLIFYFTALWIARRNRRAVVRFIGKVYPEEVAEILVENCLKIDAESAKRISAACSDYQLEPMPIGLQRRVHIELDTTERAQLKAIRRYFPNVDFTRHPHSRHCENMAQDPERYIRRMMEWMTRG